jgi:GR25 family glycosyltransferase involved in LPS biosynthesis
MNLANVHIITIDQTEEYFKQALQTLKHLNLPIGTKISFGGQKGQFISKSDRDQLTQYSGWNLKNSGNNFWDRDMTEGEFGCVVSHIRTWSRCHYNYIYPILILEQDFVPLFDLNWSVFDEIENYDWDIILLGRKPLAKDTEVGLNYFVKPGYSYQAHAYILSKSGLRKIQENIETLMDNLIPTDEFLPALFSTHPRADIDTMYPNKINALALRVDAVAQSDWEGTGRSRTAPK